MSLKKGQILALTIFIVFLSLGIILALLMPINQQVIRMRRLFYGFQALTTAESALEIGNLYSLKGITNIDFIASILAPTSSAIINAFCNQHYNYACSRGNYNVCTEMGYPQSILTFGCLKYVMRGQDFIVEMYVAPVYKEREEEFLYSYFVKNVSRGSFKDLSRVLDFDFLP